MNEKKLMPEGSYISDFQIKQGEKTLLEAYQSGSMEREKKLLLLLKTDFLGSDSDFGREQLAEMLSAASNAEILPQYIALTDKAVLLACSGNAALGSLCRMEAMGTEILIDRNSAGKYACELELCCGGQVEAAQIWSALLAADKIISL